MRRCNKCQSTHLKRAQFDYDYSTECGIAEIVVSSAERIECLDCNHVTVELGKLKEIDAHLMKLICAQQGLLTGRQSRFLRLRVFNQSIPEFSKETGIDSATLELTENDNLDHHPENSTKIRSICVARLATQTYILKLGDETIETD